ncbi:MAG: uroporphyrinogen-III synthase [Marinobacter sp.]|nr:uroporphyrinogen-III synthase [Marinobacter sp.]
MDTHQADTDSLRGRRILVCRPEPEARRLADHLSMMGAEVRCLPMLSRESLDETPEQRAILQDLDQYEHIIAVSPYAARQLLERIDHWWPQYPVQLKWYGVGDATARVFRQAQLTPIAPDTGFASEDLLQLPALREPSGSKVLVACGEGGRGLIQSTLRERGARVTELVLYRRYQPAYTPAAVNEALNLFDPDALITLSGETLNNLIALGENTDHNLKQRLLVVPVERVAETARAAGFRMVCIPASLDDDAIAVAIGRALNNNASDHAD